MLIWLLFFTSSSILLSSSLAIISPAVFLQLGLPISSFMASTLVYSFCSNSRILMRSPASLSSCDFMYSLMYFSPSLKDSSMMKSSRSLRFLNSSVMTRYILELKFQILMLTLAISFRTFTPRFSRHWEDSILADSKLVEQDTKPVHISLFCLGQLIPRDSRATGCLRSSKSSKLLNRLSWSPPLNLMLLVWRGTKFRLGSTGAGQVSSDGAKALVFPQDSSKQGYLDLTGAIFDSAILSFDLLLLFLGFLTGELVKREFFLRKVRRLLSVLLMQQKQQIQMDSSQQELIILFTINETTSSFWWIGVGRRQVAWVWGKLQWKDQFIQIEDCLSRWMNYDRYNVQVSTQQLINYRQL